MESQEIVKRRFRKTFMGEKYSWRLRVGVSEQNNQLFQAFVSVYWNSSNELFGALLFQKYILFVS